jgi:CBS-domain-containing membrane protein
MRPLYCDESIWVPVADGLRRRGWTVYEATRVMNENGVRRLPVCTEEDELVGVTSSTAWAVASGHRIP